MFTSPGGPSIPRGVPSGGRGGKPLPGKVPSGPRPKEEPEDRGKSVLEKYKRTIRGYKNSGSEKAIRTIERRKGTKEQQNMLDAIKNMGGKPFHWDDGQNNNFKSYYDRKTGEIIHEEDYRPFG